MERAATQIDFTPHSDMFDHHDESHDQQKEEDIEEEEQAESNESKEDTLSRGDSDPEYNFSKAADGINVEVNSQVLQEVQKQEYEWNNLPAHILQVAKKGNKGEGKIYLDMHKCEEPDENYLDYQRKQVGYQYDESNAVSKTMVFEDEEDDHYRYTTFAPETKVDTSMYLPSGMQNSLLDKEDMDRIFALKDNRRQSNFLDHSSVAPSSQMQERKAALLKSIENQVLGGLTSTQSDKAFERYEGKAN